jgi:hypothetical protein
MFNCLPCSALQAPGAGPNGQGILAKGRSQGGPAWRKAGLVPLAASQTGIAGRGAGHGGSCPAQRDQATLTADPLGRRP